MGRCFGARKQPGLSLSCCDDFFLGGMKRFLKRYESKGSVPKMPRNK